MFPKKEVKSDLTPTTNQKVRLTPDTEWGYQSRNIYIYIFFFTQTLSSLTHQLSTKQRGVRLKHQNLP